ncbi:hypothetical protein JXC34_03725 [Candidatus Woesearchaeota archaeon]|nr:hypothetical protein [Candidatus Woesearchaeota archaeon]
MLSAGYIIKAVSHYARELGVSDYLIGFLVVAIGTSLPEMTTAFVASFKHAGEIVLGDVIGANIIDVTIVLGVTSIIGRKIFIHGKVIDKTLFTVMLIAILPLILGYDGRLSRLDGAILVISFFLYIFNLLKKEGHFGKLKKDVKLSLIWKDLVVISFSLAVLLVGANFMISSSRTIGIMIGIPDIVLGIVLMAVGTTIPELTVETMSVLKGVSGIAFGDILGSVVCNSSLVLGIGALITPIQITNRVLFRNSSLFMLTSVFIALLFIKKKEITWKEGVGLLMVYATFLVTEALAGII